MDLGPPQLVDGFANGWHVTAADLHTLGGPGFTVELTWTPQREVWAALAVSGATLLLCLVLGFLPVRAGAAACGPTCHAASRGPAGPDAAGAAGIPLRRRHPGLARGTATQGGTPTGLAALPAGAAHRRADRGCARPWSSAPVAALVVAGVVILGLLVPWARVVATVGGIAFVVAGCVNVVQGQNVHHYLPGSDWAGSFVHAGNLIWVGVVLLLADAVISGLGLRVKKPLGRRATRAGTPPAAPATPAPPAPPATPATDG